MLFRLLSIILIIDNITKYTKSQVLNEKNLNNTLEKTILFHFSTNSRNIKFNTFYSTNEMESIVYAISKGFIMISTKQKAVFNIANIYNNKISICYNKYYLYYGRNVSRTPWFVCPWNKLNYRFCCGSKYNQYCCRYFDRPGHLAALIIGITIILFVIVGCLFTFYKKTKTKMQSTVSIQYINDKINVNCPRTDSTPDAFRPAYNANRTMNMYVISQGVNQVEPGPPSYYTDAMNINPQPHSLDMLGSPPPYLEFQSTNGQKIG